MTDVVVVGAGPYGLSVAANLLRAGVRVRVFGRPMEAWKEHMPEGMLLKSDGFATNIGALPLTLEKFCLRSGRPFQRIGHRTPVADLIAYADAVRSEYIGHIDDVQVTRIDPCKGGFIVRMADGDELFGKRVVCATGLTGSQRMPMIPGMPAHRMTHASQHHDLRGFAGSRVLVLGAGQSAFEISALLHEQGGMVEILTRRPPIWFDPASEAVPSQLARLRHPNFGLGPGWRSWLWSEAPTLFRCLPARIRLSKAYSTFGPAGSGWLKHRVVGKIKTRTGPIVHATETTNGVQITAEIDGAREILEADHVIAATGYSPSIEKIPFLQPLHSAIDCFAGGLPVLDRSYQTSVRGLHIVGCLSAPSFGPSMRFIYGTNFAAPQLRRAIGHGSRRVIIGYTRAEQIAPS
jgi:FAD-dependent urate hydroxylase